MSMLDEIQARADAATKGPWGARDCAPCTERGRLEVNIYDHTGNFQIATWCDDDEFHRPDAVFIAHAREDVPKLVAALRAVEAVCDAWTKQGESDMAFSKTMPQNDAATMLLIDGAQDVENARLIQTAIWEALG